MKAETTESFDQTDSLETSGSTNTSAVARRLSAILSTNGLVVVIIVVAIVFGILTDWTFTSPRNIPILLRQAAVTGIVAAGVALVIIAGQIDLSIGSAVGLCAIVVAWLMEVAGMSPIPAAIITMIVGLLLGAWQGLAVAWWGVPSFVVTLGGLLIFRGIGLIITEGKTIASFPESFLKLSQGAVGAPVAIGLSILVVGWWLATAVRLGRRVLEPGLVRRLAPRLGLALIAVAAVAYASRSTRGVPVPVVIMVAVSLGLEVLASRGRFGRHVYAVGGNRDAALLAGIKVTQITFRVFLLMGGLYGLTGLVLAARLNGAPPGGAPFLELDAIAAAVIGGVSLQGGVGRVGNALLGAVLLAAVNNGLSLMNVPTFYQLVVSGLILIVAVFLDTRAKARA